MTDVFVLRNQHDEFLNKSHEWIAAGDSKTLYRSAHRDEVINEKVELTVKRPDLRIKVVAGEQQSNGRILIDSEEPLPKTLAVADDDNLTDTSAEAKAPMHEAAENEVVDETIQSVVDLPLDSHALYTATELSPTEQPLVESAEAETKQRSLAD